MTQKGPIFGSAPESGTVTPSTTISSQPADQLTSSNGPSSPAAESSKMASRPDLTQHAVSLADYFFHVGYLGQNWTDIQLTFFDTGVALHRIILARCPYIHRLIHNTAPGQSIHLSFNDENITAGSVHIALQHLYRPCQHLVDQTNARSVLVTALLFEGMPELAHRAYTVLRDSISTDNILDHIEWLDRRSHAAELAFGSISANGHAIDPAQGEWARSPRYGEYSASLKSDVLEYLLHTLPTQIPPSDPRLISIYSHLPYDLFKLCVEHPDLPVGSMQDRFSFAKKVLAARKKLGVGSGPLEETVALGFKDGSSGVEVNRKAKRGRQFFKIEAN